MLAKREYELIAGIIKGLGKRPTRIKVAQHFASRLELSNGRFDRDKFLEACGIDEGYNPVGEAIEFFERR